jgi:hypothetical protein
MRALVLLLGLLAGGCVTGAPDAVAPSSCADPSPVAGTWRDHRMTQVGPAYVTVTFRCDCTFESTIQGLVMRVKQKGTYDTAARELRFGDATTWPFELVSNTLVIHEAGERHEFGRVASQSCVTSSARTSSSATSPR